jgi:hypothetical protein
MESSMANPFFSAIGATTIPGGSIVPFGFLQQAQSTSNLFQFGSLPPNETSITRISKQLLRKKLLRTTNNINPHAGEDGDLVSEVAGGNKSRIFVGKKKKKKKKKIRVIPRKDIEFGVIQERSRNEQNEVEEEE